MKDAGFSLVELIIVIAIIAVLVGALAPQYIKYVEKSKESKDEQMAEQIFEVANVIAADVDYQGRINAGDKIWFGRSGITTNSTLIEQQILPIYMPGFNNIRAESKRYQNQTYTMEFIQDAEDNKLAVRVGWE